MFFTGPVLNRNQIDVFVPGCWWYYTGKCQCQGVTAVSPDTGRPAQISWTSQIREIQEISANDGHLQPPSDPQINCTTAWKLLTWQINVLEHWFHSCGHLRGFKRLEFLLKWVKWHSRWFPGFCAVSVCQLLSLRHWYLHMRIFHPTSLHCNFAMLTIYSPFSHAVSHPYLWLVSLKKFKKQV